MSSYIITDYTRKRAKEIGVEVKPSKMKHKKIAVFKDNKKIADIGDTDYFDYPTYVEKVSKTVADERQRLYYIRHAKDIIKPYSPGWLAAKLLW